MTLLSKLALPFHKLGRFFYKSILRRQDGVCIDNDGFACSSTDDRIRESEHQDRDDRKPLDVTTSKNYRKDFYCEFDRLTTYPLLWSNNITKRDLAKHGFYHVPEKRQSRCVFCNISLGDSLCQYAFDLYDLHRFLSADCVFAHGSSLTRNVPLESVLDMGYERSRLVSILWRDWRSRVCPETLAKNGFYHRGIDNETCCQFCRLTCLDWRDDDDVALLHKKCNPRCKFVMGLDVRNFDVSFSQTKKSQRKIYASVLPVRDTTAESYDALDEIKMIYPTAHPRFESGEHRMRSFWGWPSQFVQVHENDLVAAGFFYEGFRDQVVCFECGGHVDHWQKYDSPIRRHAQKYPDCHFVASKMGLTYSKK
jgi:hypothetical protein